MAELMLLSEIADPTRFFTDNLLGPEDWGAWRAAWGREGAAAGGTPAHAVRKRAPREKAGPIRNPHSEGGRNRGPVVLRGAGVGETSACCRCVELFRGREGGAAVRRYRFSGGRAVGLASGSNEGWTRAVRRWPPPRPARADAGPLADCTLYAGLDQVAEEQAQLFRCPEQDVPVWLPAPCPPLGGWQWPQSPDSAPAVLSHNPAT